MARGYRTKAERDRLLARWRASGSSREAFCARSGISESTLRRWLAEEAPPMAFVELVAEAPRAPTAPVVVVLVGGTRLIVEAGSPVALVAELARALA